MADALTGTEFLPTDLDHISPALGAAVSEREERAVYRVSSSTNMVVLASCRGKLSELSAIIDSLSIVHPGRYFAVYSDDGANDLRVEVSARCYGLSKHESLCSEVIMIGAPAARAEAVPSVVFAHLLSGNPIELFLCDPCADPMTIEAFVPVCESVLLSSSQYIAHPAMLRDIAARVPAVVDLDWLGLGVWRRQIARAFDRPALRELLPELSRIRIAGALGRTSEPYLLAGWVASCLQARVTSADGSHCMLERAGALPIELTLTDAPAAGVGEIRFELGGARRSARARFVRTEALETFVEDEDAFYAEEPLGDESWSGRFRLYFEAGESIAAFKPSLEKALEISAA